MTFPSFDCPVPDNGYRWWYIDAVSDDDQHALTVIVFIGSVFSPYYSWARKKGNAPAANHCAINVALYGKPWRWCMTERTRSSVALSPEAMSIGKSRIGVDGNTLRVSIDEISVPLPARLRGELTLELPGHSLDALALDEQKNTGASHFWQPVAPQTRINVEFDKPDLSWKGSAYVDSNHGSVPLESSFRSWVWSRSHAEDGSTRILYDVIDKEGVSSQHSACYTRDGRSLPFSAEQKQPLPATRYWRIPRNVRTPAGTSIENLQTLEDTPFYSRTRFNEAHNGTSQVTVHESLYLDRFDTPWVRCLLPFRMPRSTRPVMLA